MKDFCNGQLKVYSSVLETAVDWLWYPYIPFGKLTLVQGDPGCGKSTLLMNIISAASTGTSLPDGRKPKKPLHIIYQCSEDGAADTIKPRLTSAGADCNNVAFLDEEIDFFSLSDDRIRQAIAEFNAKLLVIDPIQAYLGDNDMSSAGAMRKMLRQLSSWAAMYDCAIVLIGHLNKRQGAKMIYRALGSIDVVAAARSVIEVDSYAEDSEVRILRHIKSSLTAKGKNLYFSIDGRKCIRWLSEDDFDESGELVSPANDKKKKQDIAAEELLVILANGPVRSSDIQTFFRKEGISEKTVLLAKKMLDIQSFKKDSVWFWQLPVIKSDY